MTLLEQIYVEIKKRMEFHDNAMKSCSCLNTIVLTHSAGYKEDCEILAFIDAIKDIEND